MWPITYELAAVFFAAALCSLAVKLTDDWLDRERDRAAGRPNLAAPLGTGAMVYAALLLALAAGLHAAVTVALFFASYVIGMFHDFGRLMPSRLSGWQESFLVLVGGAAICGGRLMLFALCFVAAVQFVDDCLDLAADRLAGQRNLACRLGVAECLLLALAALLAAWWLDARVFGPVAAGVAAVYLGSFRRGGVEA